MSYDVDGSSFINWKEGKKLWDKYGAPLGYKGIVNKADTSNEVRLSSVLKYERSILDVSYYKDGYQTYCKQYAEWQEWNESKNKERFQEVLDHKNFDAKNMCECVRILTMAKEMAEGKGVILNRRGIDRDFLLSIKNHEQTYDEILAYVESIKKDMLDSFSKSTLPEAPDIRELENIMIKIRTDFYDLRRGSINPS
jgi:hypothetical protein